LELKIAVNRASLCWWSEHSFTICRHRFNALQPPPEILFTSLDLTLRRFQPRERKYAKNKFR